MFDGFEPSGDAFDVLLFILLGIAVETGISKNRCHIRELNPIQKSNRVAVGLKVCPDCPV